MLIRELVHLLQKAIYDVAGGEVLLWTWVPVVVVSVILHRLGVEAAIEMTGDGTASCMFAAGCNRQRGHYGTRQQRAAVVVCGGGSEERICCCGCSC